MQQNGNASYKNKLDQVRRAVKSDALLFYFFGREQFLWDCEVEALGRILLSRLLNRNKYKARYLLPKEGMPEHNLQFAYIPQRSGS